MKGEFLLRFDDVCPTMDWDVWCRVERVLCSTGVHPILAVVPDNRDHKLVAGPARADFWDKVRTWQARGWTIGWHGYQHLYVTRNSGIVGLNTRSEFAGLSAAEQEQKLALAAQIFADNGVRPTIWVAPGHTFDRCTVLLLRKFGVRLISDGHFASPVIDGGCVWIPQQLWSFRSMPFGTWTICFHINGWSDQQCSSFEHNVGAYASRITSVERILNQKIRTKSVVDDLFASAFLRVIRVKRWLGAARRNRG